MTRAEARMVAEELFKVMKSDGIVEDKVLGVSEAAQILGVKEQTIYNHANDLPCTKFMGKLRFFQSDLYKLLRR